jgi:cytidyltransferase-like protein
MNDTIDFGVFIGRFQPLHVGHEHVITHALERVNRLIVLVGSANMARDPRNPSPMPSVRPCCAPPSAMKWPRAA